MRTIVSWAWFRPSEKAWDKGARWYRCDVVGGGEESKDVRRAAAHRRRAARRSSPPTTTWMVCVNGASVQRRAEDLVHRDAQLACGHHDQGRRPGGPLPRRPARRGDHPRLLLATRSGAWLGYPPEYDFGYTWFHEGEWKAGNRRSVCWAATTA